MLSNPETKSNTGDRLGILLSPRKRLGFHNTKNSTGTTAAMDGEPKKNPGSTVSAGSGESVVGTPTIRLIHPGIHNAHAPTSATILLLAFVSIVNAPASVMSEQPHIHFALRFSAMTLACRKRSR